MKGLLIKSIKLITLLAVISASFIFLTSCGNEELSSTLQEETQVENIEFKDIKFDNIVKIGIVPKLSDEKKKAYVLKKEILVTDKTILSKFASIAFKGQFELVFADRLPSEYILTLHFKDGVKRKAYYWVQCSNYNLTIDGVQGSITVDSKEMDDLITKAANEIGRKRNVDPY
jgi:hypothetical protein